MSTFTKDIEDARSRLESAVKSLDEQDTRIQALPDDADDAEVEFHDNEFRKRQNDVGRAERALERMLSIAEARRTIPPLTEENGVRAIQNGDKRTEIRVGNEPHTYRQDSPHLFFRDMYFAQKGDGAAAERIQRHHRETRDVTTADPGAGTFVPPVYLGELWAEYPRNRRPFADRVRHLPLPENGTSFTIPRQTTGVTVASQAGEASALSETDADGTLLTVNIELVGGQQDMSIQAFERTDPTFDRIVFQDLRAAYDAEVDRQLLHGAGHGSNELPGIGGVSGRNTVTYTDATPTAAEFVPQLYNVISQIADGRKEDPDLLVMHHRRAAWLASNLSSVFPLFQLGSLNQAAGQQAGGFTNNFAGLDVIRDGNVITTEGAGTNQDRAFVVCSQDIMLFEGPLRTRVLEQTLANTLQIKIQLFAYVAAATGRQPEAIGEVVGTGMVAPTFA